MKDWYNNEEFWEKLEPFLFDSERQNAAAPEVDKIISLLKLSGKESVLDLCCGPGRHTLAFARRGFNVMGVDRTERYLERAKNSADVRGLKINYVKSDMREFKKENSFDTALMMFTSFGYFDNPDDDRQVLKNIYASLKKNGYLLIESAGREIIKRTFQPRDWREVDGNFLLEERDIDLLWPQIKNRWIVIEDGIKYEFNLSIRLYSAGDLSGLLSECGFGEIKVYGNLSGVPYDENAERLVVVAVKK